VRDTDGEFSSIVIGRSSNRNVVSVHGESMVRVRLEPGIFG